ncbi:MAG: HD-GYP domain-containing protein [Oscillospiraceae bacterium]|nr:HD-GYP domain-containing protein [Oscillospiraceae bacterium]
MQTHIYECAKLTLDFITMMMISRYIFLIPPMKKNSPEQIFNPQFVFIAVSYVLIMLFCLAEGTIAGSVVIAVCMLIYCHMTEPNPKRKLLKSVQFIPIAGMCYGILMPMETLPVTVLHLSESAGELYSMGLYLLLLVLLLYFVFYGRDWRKNFRKEMHYRRLQAWERILLYVIGILMYGFVGAVYSYYNLDETNFRQIAMFESLMMSMIGFTVTLTVIILILVGNKNAHTRRDLLEMQHNVIATLADIVENRDESTGGHIRRTARYVQIIAEKLLEEGWYQSILNEQYIKDMVVAAPLHDIGKIHVPDSILKKQGKLTDEEYEIMKSHTTEGRKLLLHAEKSLGNFSYLDIAVEMAYGHHEWWNGKGYPQGIAEHNIPLCARIMAVADVFDAIVSQRCYKGSMTIEEAYEIIQKEKGTHFDPIVVSAFLKSRDKISEALKEFEDPLLSPKAEIIQHDKKTA